MTAVATPAPTVARPGWLRSWFAVFVAGFIVSSGTTIAAESFGWRAVVTAAIFALVGVLCRPSSRPGRVYATVPFDAIGDHTVNVMSVRVPDVRGIRVGVLNLLDGSDSSVEGVGIHADEPVTFTLSAVRCQGTVAVDRLDMDVTVDGRKFRQVVRLDSSVEVPCSR